MAEVQHSALTGADLHLPHRQVFADAAARAADSTTYTSADLGSLAFQADTGAVYVLTATTPTWTLQGAQGDTGPTGATGATGDTGPQGDTGPSAAVTSVWVPVYPDTAGVQPDMDVVAPFAGTVAISRYHTGTAPAVGTAGVTLTNTRDSDLILDAVDAIAGIGTAPVAMTVANADVQAGDLLTLSVDFSATVTPAAAADGTPQSTIVFVYTFTGA